MKFENKPQAISTLIVNVDEDLHLQEENGQVVVSSRYIAERFGKGHNHVIRDIENLINDGGVQNWTDLFIESKYQHPQNKQWYKEYLLTRDGFTLLAMGFTGKEALHWKLKYIEAFNKMEQQLNQPQVMTFEEIMIAQLQEQQKIKQQLNQVNHNALQAVNTAERVANKLDKQMTINATQQKHIQDAVKKKVYERLNRCKEFDVTFDTAMHKAQFFSSLYGDLKKRFGVPTYRDILFVDYDDAIAYVTNWREPAEIRG